MLYMQHITVSLYIWMDLALIEIKSLYPAYLQYLTNSQFHFLTWYQYGFSLQDVKISNEHA